MKFIRLKYNAMESATMIVRSDEIKYAINIEYGSRIWLKNGECLDVVEKVDVIYEKLQEENDRRG